MVGVSRNVFVCACRSIAKRRRSTSFSLGMARYTFIRMHVSVNKIQITLQLHVKRDSLFTTTKFSPWLDGFPSIQILPPPPLPPARKLFTHFHINSSELFTRESRGWFEGRGSLFVGVTRLKAGWPLEGMPTTSKRNLHVILLSWFLLHLPGTNLDT